MKKKVFAGLLAVVMMAVLAVPAMALTSYELFSGWEQDGYPGGVTLRSKRGRFCRWAEPSFCDRGVVCGDWGGDIPRQIAVSHLRTATH